MKRIAVIAASATLFAVPAFADSVTVQTNGSIQPPTTVVIPTSPPVAAAPTEQRTYDSHSVSASDGGVTQTDKHTQETVTPEGTSRSTTTIQQQSN